ncbi:hypothetical protein R3P38DRAFT_3242600 [Favolaschia claudopus]|uniref:Uncharacterized protein n=1 Tax=Favolaschia claudopus TaxID=2862362 RepID=A0AAV9Z4E9_9AGAR
MPHSPLPLPCLHDVLSPLLERNHLPSHPLKALASADLLLHSLHRRLRPEASQRNLGGQRIDFSGCWVLSSSAALANAYDAARILQLTAHHLDAKNAVSSTTHVFGSDSSIGRLDSPRILRSSLLLPTPEREEMTREMGKHRRQAL